MSNFFIFQDGNFSYVVESMQQIYKNLNFENKYKDFYCFNKFIPFFYEYYKRVMPEIPEEVKISTSFKVVYSNKTLVFFKDMFESIKGDFGSINDVGDQRRTCTISPSEEVSKIEIIDKAILLLSYLNPWIHELLKLVMTFIIPCHTSNQPLGVSGGLFLGISLISVNNRENSEFDITKLSVKIAHEVAHQVLFTYEYLDSIVNKNDIYYEIYSPQRKVKRRLFQAVHAIAVSFYELMVYEKIVTCNDFSIETKEKHFTEAKELIAHLERGLNEMESLPVIFPEHTNEIISECLAEFPKFKKIFN